MIDLDFISFMKKNILLPTYFHNETKWIHTNKDFLTIPYFQNIQKNW